MTDVRKTILESLFKEIKKDISKEMGGRQPIQTQVSVPKIAADLLESFAYTHEEGECLGCERMYVTAVVAAYEAIGLPTQLIQDVVNEWMVQIRKNPPAFLIRE